MTDNIQPLVSLITPCYNGENYILPYIQDLLSQTYSNVEYIFVNDGSIDRTEEIIHSYQKQFEDKGWKFIYIKKENGCAASAINAGLKVFSGDYLCWIDSDDIILPTYMEEMTGYLNQNPDKGFVYPWVEHIREEDGKSILIQKRIVDEEDNLFDDFFLSPENNLCHDTFAMAKSSCFIDTHPTLILCDKYKSGQIAQIIYPLAYKYKCGYIQKILAKYVVRKNSDCHDIRFLRKRRFEWHEHDKETILNMDMPEYEKYYYYGKMKDNYYNNFIKSKSHFDHKQIKVKIFGIPLIKGEETQNKIKLKLLGIPFISIRK